MKKVLISQEDFAKIIGADGKTFYEGCLDADFERLKRFADWFDAQPDIMDIIHEAGDKYKKQVLSKMETTEV